MNAKTSCGDASIAKQLFFPSYTDAGSNQAFHVSQKNETNEEEFDDNVINSKNTIDTPLQRHKVEYDGSQVGGYAPSDTPDFAHLSQTIESSSPSPLVPKKLGMTSPTDSFSSVNISQNADNSMTTNTGACSSNPPANDVKIDCKKVIHEEEEPDMKEDDSSETKKYSVFSPSEKIGDHEINENSTPSGTTISSPPKMTRYGLNNDEGVDMHQSSTFPPVKEHMESSLEELSTKYQIKTDKSKKSQIQRLPNTATLSRAKSHGEQSEAPSSLLGCTFLESEISALNSTTTNVALLKMVAENEMQKSKKSDKSLPENGERSYSSETNEDTSQIETETEEKICKLEEDELKKSVDYKDNDDDDLSVEANSLVSEYGSDVGNLKFRFDDIDTMVAVEEEESSEEAKEDNSVENDKIFKKTESSIKFHTPLMDLQNDSRLSFGDENDKENSGALHRDIRAGSTSFLKNHNRMDEGTEILIDENEDKFLSIKTGGSLLASPGKPNNQLRLKQETTPNSPIAAVSAAIRRIGTGMSNMSRGNKSPQSTASSSLQLDLKKESGVIRLSPRLGSFGFRTSKTVDNEEKSSLDIGRGARNHIESPLHHVSGCLSFVPDSGLPPYGNMRLNDSPPSSPMLLPRRSHAHHSQSTSNGSQPRLLSKSWEASSNRTSTNSGMSNGHRDTLRTRPIRLTPGSHSFSGLSAASTGVAFRNNGASVMIREGQPFQTAISPRRRRKLIDPVDRPEIPPPLSPQARSKDQILLQSPQRVVDIEREDALDILALLVERSVAFHEKKDELASNVVEEKVEEEGEDDSKLQKCSSHEDDERQVESLPSYVTDIQESIEELRVISKNYDNDSAKHAVRMRAIGELQRSHTYALEMNRAALSASTWLCAIGRGGGKRESTSELFCVDDQHSTVSNNSDSLINEQFKTNSNDLRLALQKTQLQLTAKDELNKRLDHELSFCRAEIGRLKSVARSDSVFKSPNKSILDEEVDDDSSASTNEEGFLDTATGTEIISSFLHSSNPTDADSSTESSESLPCIVEARESLLLKAKLEQANRRMHEMEAKLENLKNKSVAGENITEPEVILACDEKNETNQNTASGENNSLPIEDGKRKSGGKDALALPSKLCPESIFFTDLLKDDLDNYIEVVRKTDKAEIDHLKEQLMTSQESKNEEEKSDENMIHVRMLDGENFVTEWDKLGPLPPPPEHNLHSPIVNAVLSQWTDDCSTRDALISWMEKLMGGEHPNSVPPLKLSSLDYQVRQGFTMHILPLLLRRSDLHLEARERISRRTSYDIIVTVKSPQSVPDSSVEGQEGKSSSMKQNSWNNVCGSQKMAFMASGSTAGINDSEDSGMSLMISSSHDIAESSKMESGSVTHSSVTAHISNKIANAVGGLLSRRNNHQSLSSPSFEDEKHYESNTQCNPNDPLLRNIYPNSLPSLSSQIKSGESISVSNSTTSIKHDDEDQPYHRVVSAPPGRIGMTFVQYRGHAIISDVCQDSPLSGWVFPSDILIAIDEVPVSGMRVQEIVKLLTARKERQRALRVISSHAMTDLMTNQNMTTSLDG